MAYGACRDKACEIEDRWIGSLGISSAIAAKSRDHRRTLLGVPIRISNLADRGRRRSQISGMGQLATRRSARDACHCQIDPAPDVHLMASRTDCYILMFLCNRGAPRCKTPQIRLPRPLVA